MASPVFPPTSQAPLHGLLPPRTAPPVKSVLWGSSQVPFLPSRLSLPEIRQLLAFKTPAPGVPRTAREPERGLLTPFLDACTRPIQQRSHRILSLPSTLVLPYLSLTQPHLATELVAQRLPPPQSHREPGRPPLCLNCLSPVSLPLLPSAWVWPTAPCGLGCGAAPTSTGLLLPTLHSQGPF